MTIYTAPHGINPNGIYRINTLTTNAATSERSYTSPSGQVRIIRAKPANVGLLPISKSTLWAMVRCETFPKPFKISENVTAWRGADIIEWLDARKSEDGSKGGAV